MVGYHGRNLARWLVLLALFSGSGCASTSTPGCWSDFCAKWNSCNLSSMAKCCGNGKCGGCLKCKLHEIDCKTFAHTHKPHYHVDPAHTRHKPTSIFTFPKMAVAPVGSEVVMLAGVCGRDGHLRTEQPIEWNVAPGSVGYFMAVGRRSALKRLTSFGGEPHKLDNTYALGTTSTQYTLLTRGTPTLEDDVAVLRGQSWVSVTSPVEGTSYVTVFSPEVPEWDRRQHTSTIHWVDAQWAFPPPAVNPVGTRHVFTTTIQRATDQSPVIGWRVRYEIVGGPDAGFAPDGAKVIEVPSNDLGQASVEIFQPQPAPGVNQISIQVIRPTEVSLGMGQRLVLGMGTTTKTWTSPDVAMRMTGPTQAALGSIANYRIEVNNPGEAVVRDVVVSDTLPAGLSFQSSVPQATGAGGRIEWRLGDLRGQEARTIELNVRVDQPGIINHCATLSTAEGLNAQSCVSTTVQEGAGIDVQMYGPASASVGGDITFEIVVTNRGTAAVQGLSISDRYDPGLAHEQAANPIERSLGDLAPGETRRIGVTLRAIAAGQQCNTVDVRDVSGPRATARACVNVVEGAVVPPVGAGPPTDGPQPSVAVQKTGPQSVRVGEDATFDIMITNNGAVTVNNIRVVDNYDAALSAVAASDGSRPDGSNLVWIIDTLPPGRRFKLQVQCRGVQASPSACNRVTVTTQEGARADSQACLAIVEATRGAGGGGAGLRMTITDQRDPVAVGQEGAFTIRVTNNGQATERDIVMTVIAPPEMTPVSTRIGSPLGGDVQIQGQQFIFSPVRELGPGQALTYQVQMRANRPGRASIQAQVTSAGQAQPLQAAEETTLVSQ